MSAADDVERGAGGGPDAPVGARQAAAPTGEQPSAPWLVARRATEASLGLADEPEAAWRRRMVEGSGRWPDRRTGRYTIFLDTTDNPPS